MLSPGRCPEAYLCGKKMEKKTRLKIVNFTLVFLLLLVTVSSVMLECLGGSSWKNLSGPTQVFIHIVVSLTIFALSYRHIALHFGNSISRWHRPFRNTKKQNRWLLAVMAVTLASGIAATVTYFTHGHTSLGGIHGKIGFAALAFMLLHLIRRRKWLSQMR